MTKTNLMIDDFYNDDIIVKYEIERTQKESIDFYSAKKHIRKKIRPARKLGVKFKRAFGGKRIHYTEELGEETSMEHNIIVPLDNVDKVEVPLHKVISKNDKNSPLNPDNLSLNAQEKIGRYKNLLENVSISGTINKDSVSTAMLNTDTTEETSKKSGFFGGIKNLFGLKNS